MDLCTHNSCILIRYLLLMKWVWLRFWKLVLIVRGLVTFRRERFSFKGWLLVMVCCVFGMCAYVGYCFKYVRI